MTTGTPSHPPTPLTRDLAEVSDALACCGPDDERELLERLVLTALPLADGMARRYRGRGVDDDDLEQVARAALVSASRRYDPSVGSGFEAFAAPCISGELKRWFRDHTWSVRPPRRLQELRQELRDTEEWMRHELSREPTDAELAASLEVDVARLREVRLGASAYHSSSLDVPTTSGDAVGDHVAVVDDDTARVDTHWALLEALSHVTEREALILRLRFEDELTQREIGRAVGVSQMQVSRILTGVLRRLRCRMVDVRAA